MQVTIYCNNVIKFNFNNIKFTEATEDAVDKYLICTQTMKNLIDFIVNRIIN